jgi:hypothetical protein
MENVFQCRTYAIGKKTVLMVQMNTVGAVSIVVNTIECRTVLVFVMK